MSELVRSTKAVVVSPSDTVNLPVGCIGLYVGGTGNVTIVNPDDTTCLFTAVPVGAVIPTAVKRVNNTATTATLIVGLYG